MTDELKSLDIMLDGIRALVEDLEVHIRILKTENAKLDASLKLIQQRHTHEYLKKVENK